MNIVKNILAFIGFLAILAGGWGYTKVQGELSQLDPKAIEIYTEFFNKFMETRDLADAMMWAIPVEEGLTVDDVKKSLQSLATSNNFLFVGESPFYKQAEAVTGKPYRHISFMSFCDVRVGMQMADYNEKYTAFMPCRIAVVEDKKGKLWLFSMNLDMMIYGGKPLPPELKASAEKVRNTIYAIMEGAAKGEF